MIELNDHLTGLFKEKLPYIKTLFILFLDINFETPWYESGEERKNNPCLFFGWNLFVTATEFRLGNLGYDEENLPHFFFVLNISKVPPFFFGIEFKYIKKFIIRVDLSLWGSRKYPFFDTEKSISRFTTFLFLSLFFVL